MSGGGDSYRFPPRRPGGEPVEEEPPPARPLAALIALAAGAVCVAASVVVEVDDSGVAKMVATASLAVSVLAAGIALLNGPREGRARAMALGGAGIAVVASVLSATVDFHHESPATRAADGTIEKAGSVPFTRARTGDCFRTPPKADASSLHAVPCSTGHRGEVVAQVDLTDQVESELDAGFQVARQRCQDAVRSAVRTSDPAVASASLLVIPSPRSTGLVGLCAVVTNADRTGSVRT